MPLTKLQERLFYLFLFIFVIIGVILLLGGYYPLGITIIVIVGLVSLIESRGECIGGCSC